MKAPILAVAVLVSGFVVAGSPALAHPNPRCLGLAGAARAAPFLASRQVAQGVRIQQGLRHGQLSRREAAGLLRQHRQIAHQFRCSRASQGRLDGRERRQLDREFDRLSRKIWRERHARERWF